MTIIIPKVKYYHQTTSCKYIVFFDNTHKVRRKCRSRLIK